MADAKHIQVYDTTLRDGCKSEDVSLTVEDKVTIAERLDDLGFDYVEGGWPGSNERDAAFFKEINRIRIRHAKIAAACRAGVNAMGLEVFAERPNSALTVVTVPAGVDGSGTLKKLEKQYGYKLADGQDSMKGKIWRLSHMGYTDAFEVLGAIAALELVLAESGVKLEAGAGVAAFQRVLAGK